MLSNGPLTQHLQRTQTSRVKQVRLRLSERIPEVRFDKAAGVNR